MLLLRRVVQGLASPAAQQTVSLVSRDLLGLRCLPVLAQSRAISRYWGNVLLCILLCCVVCSLSEVGKLEALKVGGNYDTGQMFLHKVNNKDIGPALAVSSSHSVFRVNQ